MNEREAAGRFNQCLEQMLAGDAVPADVDQDLLAVSTRLAALPSLLPSPDPSFERRVWARLRDVQPEPTFADRVLSWRLGLRVLAPLAALLLVALLVLPGPRQVMSNWMASFGLGQVDVVVVPEDTEQPGLPLRPVSFSSMAAAEAEAGFDLLEPGYLPAGYALYSVQAVSAEGLSPALDPLYVEVDYQPPQPLARVNAYAVLREFNPTRQGDGALGQLAFQSQSVRSAQDITLPNGHPAVLVEFEPATDGERVLMRQVIWEQAGSTLELWSEVLPVEEMLRIAASVQ